MTCLDRSTANFLFSSWEKVRRDKVVFGSNKMRVVVSDLSRMRVKAGENFQCGWKYKKAINNGINKKPVNIFIDFQVTISKWCIVNAPKPINAPIDFSWVDSLEFGSWIFKRTFLNFSFFYVLSCAFLTSVSWYCRRKDITWSCKYFEIGKLWGVFIVQCFHHK